MWSWALQPSRGEAGAEPRLRWCGGNSMSLEPDIPELESQFCQLLTVIWVKIC